MIPLLLVLFFSTNALSFTAGLAYRRRVSAARFGELERRANVRAYGRPWRAF